MLALGQTSRRTVLAFVATLGSLFLPSADVLAQGRVTAVHGDWELRCDTPPGAASEQCALTQYVLADDRENIGLNVLILETADGQARIMRVVAPLGVMLPMGLSLKIDEEDIGVAGFVRCVPEGCFAEVIMDDPLIAKMRAGATATFIVFPSPEEGIGIPISLNGFDEGIDALFQ